MLVLVPLMAVAVPLTAMSLPKHRVGGGETGGEGGHRAGGEDKIYVNVNASGCSFPHLDY